MNRKLRISLIAGFAVVAIAAALSLAFRAPQRP